MSVRVLLLLPKMPYPLTSGYSIKNMRLIEILSRHFSTHVVLISETLPSEQFLNLLKQYGVSLKLFVKPKVVSYLNVLKHIFDRKPMQVWYHYFTDVKAYIDGIVEDFDVIVVAGNVRMCEYVRKYSDVPKLLDLADLYSYGYKRSLENTKSTLWRILYRIEFSKLYNYEREIFHDFDKIFLFSSEEVEIVKDAQEGYSEKVERITHGVDDSLFTYTKRNLAYQDSLVFLGKMNYPPNVDAVLWFCHNVLPLLPRNIRFFVVGAEPTMKIRRLQSIYPNVYVTGYVEDPFEIVNSSCCVVAPMKTGSGIQNKVLQAMALGKICIVTDIAAKPIGGNHLEHFIIANTAEEFAYWIGQIVKKPEEYSYIGVNARKYVAENFRWELYEEKILQSINALIRKRHFRGNK